MELKEQVECLSKQMSPLGPGPLAELRRMDTRGPGTATYWALAARCGFLNRETESWRQTVKIMAILTPRGEQAHRPPLHDSKRRLGTVLCDGGDKGWPGPGARTSHPFISEDRFARLLAQRPDQRSATLERFARMLARQRDPGTGINCIDIAALVLNYGTKSQLTALARHYYRRLDHAKRTVDQQETAA